MGTTEFPLNGSAETPKQGGKRGSVLVCTVVDFAQSNAAAVHVVEIVRGLAAVGFEPELLFAGLTGEAPLLDSLECGEARFVIVPSLRRMGLPNGCNFLLMAPLAVWRCLRSKPRFVYIRIGLFSCVLTAALRLFTRAIVVTEHNGWLEDEARGIGYRPALARLLRWSQIADAKLSHIARVVTPGIGHILERSGIPPTRIRAIGNGTNLDHFTAVPRQGAVTALGLDPRSDYLGFIGNLVSWQGLELAVKAFARLAASFPNWQLIIAGDGPEQIRLRELVAGERIDRRVVFLGMVPYKKAPEVISAFDLAIAPFSARRNAAIGLSPLKLRDYAACGRAVVAADLPGITPFAASGWLRLHKPDDIDDLCAALAELMSDPARRTRMGNLARRFAETNFGWPATVAAIAAATGAALEEHRTQQTAPSQRDGKPSSPLSEAEDAPDRGVQPPCPGERAAHHPP